MGKTIRRLNRNNVPRNEPYRKTTKQSYDIYKGVSSEDIIDDDEDYDEDDN